ncbi:hypothetical protein B0H12DRAFT_121358 [Mycena haematopus]|nr:hypothetical protein B0H12DRAFT_121358 [Mycena haematopus]
MPHHHKKTTMKLVSNSDRESHLPPRNPIDSELGIIDATTLILLQKMMADSYDHGRVVWKENKARCAVTGEAESDDLPCGPNSAQKKVETWLVEAGLLAPDVTEQTESEDSDENTSPVLPTPETPRRRPWYRRLEIVIPSKASPKSKLTSSDADEALKSPRSPLSPVKLWSAVQRGTTSFPSVSAQKMPLPRQLSRSRSGPS